MTNRSKIFTLLCIAAIGVVGFYAWQNAQKNAPSVNGTATNSAQPANGYAPADWKTWQDGEYSKATNMYFGYSVRYPRDFDVAQGENANGGWIGTPRVKLAFPQDSFQTPKSNYGEAFMTVSVGGDKESVQKCYVNPGPNGGEKNPPSVTVNGVVFQKMDVVDVAAGNIYTAELYRVLKYDRCYEVALTVHTGNIANYTPGTVVEFDKEKAFSVLRKMLETFTFTNKNPSP